MATINSLRRDRILLPDRNRIRRNRRFLHRRRNLRHRRLFLLRVSILLLRQVASLRGALAGLEVRVVRVDPEDRAARADREAIQPEPCSRMEFRRSVRARVFLRSSPRRLI